MLDYLKNKIIVVVFFIGICVAAFFCPGSFVFALESYEFVANGARLDQGTGSLIVRRG